MTFTFSPKQESELLGKIQAVSKQLNKSHLKKSLESGIVFTFETSKKLLIEEWIASIS